MICKYCHNSMTLRDEYGDGYTTPFEKYYMCNCGAEYEYNQALGDQWTTPDGKLDEEVNNE